MSNSFLPSFLPLDLSVNSPSKNLNVLLGKTPDFYQCNLEVGFDRLFREVGIGGESGTVTNQSDKV